MTFEYKYLLANLLGVLPLAAGLLLARRLRMTAILCGAVLSLYSPPVSWLYEDLYWAPRRIIGSSWGVEDAMFCFHAGAISWLCALWPWGHRIRLAPQASEIIRRLVVITLCATGVLVGALSAGWSVLSAFLLAQSLSTAALLALRPEFWRLVAPGALLFLIYYFLLLALWRVLMPGFMDMWSGTELTGMKLLGVPVEEYLWVLSFAIGYPVTMAYALGARVQLPVTTTA